MKTVDSNGDIALIDSDGLPVRLGSLWDKQPVVIVWLRHYG
jgi:hypothetical protein